MTVGTASIAERDVGRNLRCKLFGSMAGRIDRETIKGCVRMTGWTASIRFREGGRCGPEIHEEGESIAGVASATSLYETVARDDCVVAGILPESRIENGKTCRTLTCNTCGDGINTHVCIAFDRIVQSGQL